MRRFQILMVVMVLISIPTYWGSAAEQNPEKTILKATPERYRFMPGCVLNVDGKKHLITVVAEFGKVASDHSPNKLVMVASHDGGQTWETDKLSVFQEPLRGTNVTSPSFLRLSDQEVLFVFSSNGMWYRRSTDNTNTWGDPVRLPYLGDPAYGGSDVAAEHAVLLKSGRILLPYYYLEPDQCADGRYSAYIMPLYSDDKGRTWLKSNRITVRARDYRLGALGERSSNPKMCFTAEEPAVVELKDGRLFMLIRTYAGWFYKSYSKDQGATWSEPVSSGIPAPGSIPTIRRIPTTGDLLLIYSYGEPEEIHGAWPRNRLASMISKDEGETFSSRRLLSGGKDFPGKVTMPAVTFLGDEALVFYGKSQSMANSYDWVQQVVPIPWFYEGDKSKVYREASSDGKDQSGKK